VKFVDCQGLAGAFTLATVQEGFELVSVKSLPGAFGVANLEGNRHLLGYDWDHESGDDTEWTVHDVPLIIGNPPCSGFSGLNTSKGSIARGPDSAINDCMWSFAKYTARVKPRTAIFESVQTAGKSGGKAGGLPLMHALWEYVREQTGLPYRLTHVFMSGATVGAAQYRHRYFWVVSLDPYGVEVPDLPAIATYRDAIGDLVGLENSWEPQRIIHAPSWWAAPKRSADNTVDAHVWPKESPVAIRFKKLFRSWKPGESLKDVIMRYDAKHGPIAGWPEKQWTAYCDPEHFTINSTVRVRWDRPGYVITGAGGQAFIHPEEGRMLSLRECARLMGFPDDWSWRTAPSVGKGFMWVGKQIPVESGRWMAKWARESLNGNPGSIQGEPGGLPNEYVINVTNAYKEQLKEQLAA
jgi:site-specific DNA-cytosine methylase